MEKMSKYVSRKPNANGFIDYPAKEHAIWETLITRQLKLIKNRACDEYLKGLEKLKFPIKEIPQLDDLNERLSATTGWEVAQVPALIGFDRFFNLLANKKFPCATFIRLPEELEYLQEPDIFHELFGHCPMLTHQPYADFAQAYGELGVGQSPYVQKMLARFYWFTAEFGLIQTPEGLHCYGGGILSSIGETVYALESANVQRKPFDVLDILRTPYRIDIYQPVYYIIDSYQQLYDVMDKNMYQLIEQAKTLGEFSPKFTKKPTETVVVC